MTNNDSQDESGTEFNEQDGFIHVHARLKILSHLYVVKSVEYVALKNQTGLTWGNISTHVRKLEDKGYITMKKEIIMRKPHSMLSLTGKGQKAFEEYRKKVKKMLG